MDKGYVSMKDMREYVKETLLPMKDRQQEIKNIIRCCEEVQESNESAYTKDCAKMRAYERIKEVMDANKD